MKIIIILLLSLFLSDATLAVELNNEQQINLLNRIGYGVTNDDLNHLKSISYESWIEEQLNPKNNEDLTIENRFKFPKNNEEFYSFYKNYDFYYNFIYLNNNDKNKNNVAKDVIFKELNKRIVYDLSSKNRLQEMMVWFWYNHFNTGVFTNTGPAIFLNTYESNLRELSFDYFHNILTMVSHSPSMLIYLNNTENKKSYNNDDPVGLNENYAREFLELHTMGVDSGYTQKDVQELAKILSGFSVLRFSDFPHDLDKINTYEDLKNYGSKKCDENFLIIDYTTFCGDEHFQGDKLFLGNLIENGNQKELDKVIEIISKRKETAHFISKKLAIYFISDNPSDEVIKKMSSTFLKNNGSIKETLKTLFLSKDFIDSLNQPTKIKDTYTYMLSVVKTGINGKYWENQNFMNDISTFFYEIEASPYFKNTPEGLSIYGKDWLSSARLQEYLFFSNMTFKKYQILKEYGINYDLISKISKNEVKNPEDATLFFTSEYWLKR